MEKFTTVISASCTFCASLQLPLEGKCGAPHGYTFNINAAIKFNTANDCFILDYNKLEELLSNHCQKLDYSNLNENKQLAHTIPSAENIAKWLINQLQQDLKEYSIHSITIQISTRPQVAISITKHVN